MESLTRPTILVLDVNETLSDLTPLAGRFEEVGAPAHLLPTWFAGVLRDGFGLTAAGAPAPFADVAAGTLGPLLGDAQSVEHVMAGFSELGVHDDVVPGIRALADAGLRLVTLTNGAASVAERLLTDAGIRDAFEALLSVEDVGPWKPHRAAYEHALARCDVAAGEAMLVAVHPWDVDGARRAGLQAAWIDRGGSSYPEHLTPPTLTASGFDDLARQLG